MRAFLKLLPVIILLLFADMAYAQQAKQQKQQDTSGAAYLKEISRREQVLLNQLDKTFDPKKRSVLTNKLAQLQEIRNSPKTREIFVENYAAQLAEEKRRKGGTRVVAQQSFRAPLSIYTAGRDWDSYGMEERFKFCVKIKDSCAKQNDLESCRFVIVRCKNFLPEQDYNSIITRFSTK